MFCPKCGKINSDDAEKCSGCDAVLHSEEVLPTVKKKSLLKFFVAALVLIAIIVVLIFVFGGCAGSNVNPNEKVLF